MVIDEKIDKWMAILTSDLKTFKKPETTARYIKSLSDAGILHYKELKNDKGIVVYTINEDFTGTLVLMEIFMYIKPEFRGNPKNFINIVRIMEQAAKENNCKKILIGSNIGYRDDKVLDLLSRIGYKKDTLYKEV